ncbi:TrbI/VirB10 family protein [Bartonella ancashensis]|uniref:Conjugative transfer protein TrbI n=1 Tax=Bartonella ancashensis TaxID=1318743 RepID=A0A0M5KSK2_9HYPH|nr:TrbI/VirB10 family protein [Bartonella ancashensis]ALE03503.1 Conjugative transfer protein TrbI [Bartonella ancashensis]
MLFDRAFFPLTLNSNTSFQAPAQNTNTSGNINSNAATAKEMLAAELGRQWGDVGIEMTRRNLNIQPTIIIRPGYNFNVMVTKDILLPAWRGHPMAILRP